MANPVFIRLAEVINKKQDMRVVSITVKPTITNLSLIHISEPTRQAEISYAVFCLKKKKSNDVFCLKKKILIKRVFF